MIFLQSHFFCDLDSRSESIWWMHPTGPRFEKWGYWLQRKFKWTIHQSWVVFGPAPTWWSWNGLTFRKLVWRGGQNPLVFSCKICIYIYISHDMCICRYLFMILKIIFRACILVIFWCADRSIYIYILYTHTHLFLKVYSIHISSTLYTYVTSDRSNTFDADWLLSQIAHGSACCCPVIFKISWVQEPLRRGSQQSMWWFWKMMNSHRWRCTRTPATSHFF